MDVALASIIASGVVAIAALLAPIFSGLIAESLKWKRELKAKRIEKIEIAATALFGLLAPWRTGDIEVAQRRAWPETYGKTLSAYYAWEQAVLPYSTEQQRKTISDLRKSWENTQDFRELSKLATEAAANVLDISRQVSEKM